MGIYLCLLDLLPAEALVSRQFLHGHAVALQTLPEVEHHLSVKNKFC